MVMYYDIKIIQIILLIRKLELTGMSIIFCRNISSEEKLPHMIEW